MLENLLRTFYDSDQYSEEVRIEALSMLMDKFTDLIVPEDSPILANLLITLFKPAGQSKQPSKEFIHFCQQVVLNKMKENELLKEAVFGLVARSVIGGEELLRLYSRTSGQSSSLAGDLYSNESTICLSNVLAGW